MPPLVRARALDSAAGLAIIQGDFAEGAAAAAESAALSRRAGDPAGAARALTTLGLAAFYAGDTPRAVAMLEESVRQARAGSDPGLAGFALMYLAATAIARADYAEAGRLCDEGETALRAVGDPEGLAWIHIVRCGAAWRTGDRPAGVAALREAMRGFRSLDHWWGLSIVLHLAAEEAAARADHRQAVWLVAAAEALRHSVAAAQLPFLKTWLEETLAQCRAALTDAAFADSWRAGGAAPAETAIAAAMAELTPDG